MDTKLPPVMYYTDELNDEFSTAQIAPIPIDGAYEYGDDGLWWRLKSFFLYRIVALPIATAYLRMKFHHTIVNRAVIRPYQKGAFFLFGNHTHNIVDALVPTFVAFPKQVFVIVHANNLSIPGLGTSTRYMGALPLPDDSAATRHFLDAIRLRVSGGNAVCIYPEAHIWPFYTGIRPFPDGSFHYPVRYRTPVFCFTNTYQKRRYSRTPRIVTYVDGPFFSDQSKSVKEQRAELREKVYRAMCERSRNNTVELVRYVRKPPDGAAAQDQGDGGA